jgi:hypothetical protein
MDEQPDPAATPRARWMAGGAALIGVVMIAVFHELDHRRGCLAVFGGLFAALGAGGVVDPRVLWAIGPHRRRYPRGVQIAGAVLAVLGLTLGGYLFVAGHP